MDKSIVLVNDGDGNYIGMYIDGRVAISSGSGVVVDGITPDAVLDALEMDYEIYTHRDALNSGYYLPDLLEDLPIV